MAFLRVLVLIWADLLATYVMWIMQTYLTDVWNLGFTHAAGIMNVANGLPKVLPLFFYFFVDAGLGNKCMLILSSLSYVIGLGFLSMSTPPVLAKVTGTCKEYEPRCLGHIQKALFYTALAFIAVGISGHIVSLVALFLDQFKKPETETKTVETKACKPELPPKKEQLRMLNDKLKERGGGAHPNMLTLPEYPLPPAPPAPINQNRSTPGDSSEVDLLSLQFQPVEAMLALVTKKKEKIIRACVLVLIPAITIFVLPYIKPWSLRFGIPAICTLVATLAFLQGYRVYKENKSKGSPITNVFRVLLASTLKMFKTNSSELYEDRSSDVHKLAHTDRLRFLDKAAIDEGQGKMRWILCTVTQVEEAKIVIRMLPIWIPLILCGVVTSIGSTYFVEQSNHLNYKLGTWKLPNSLLLILYELGKSGYTRIYNIVVSSLKVAGRQKYAPPIGIGLAIFSAVLCCIVAALVEIRRVHVIRDHGLMDKPDEDIPMTVFWLLPQYLLLAGLDSFYENSVTPFLSDQSPPSMQTYILFFNPGLSGLGIIGSVLTVYVVGRASQRNGKPNWFQYYLNASRLDRYYWTLAALSVANFAWFLVNAIWYPYREQPKSTGDEETGNQAEGDNENVIGDIGRIGRLANDTISENLSWKH